jgi:hypothetical protein
VSHLSFGRGKLGWGLLFCMLRVHKLATTLLVWWGVSWHMLITNLPDSLFFPLSSQFQSKIADLGLSQVGYDVLPAA